MIMLYENYNCVVDLSDPHGIFSVFRSLIYYCNNKLLTFPGCNRDQEQ